jgi:hypothetical protein
MQTKLPGASERQATRLIFLLCGMAQSSQCGTSQNSGIAGRAYKGDIVPQCTSRFRNKGEDDRHHDRLRRACQRV